MSELGPPRLAPPDVPRVVAHYLDNAAEYLKPLAKDEALTLLPYDQHRPDQTAWFHGLYGKCHDREFCVQLVTDTESAYEFRATLRCYIRLYPKNEENAWILVADRAIAGMAQLVAGAAALLETARLACLWRMPHIHDPDPKA